MTPFTKAEYNWHGMAVEERIEHVQKMAEHVGMTLTLEEARDVYEKQAAEQVYINDTYQVAVEECDGVVHLSIKTLDKRPCRDWRDFQQIKNELVGPECEGLELYPAESRLVDTANQYHLWVFKDPEVRIPVGFGMRLVSDKSGYGAVQRSRT